MPRALDEIDELVEDVIVDAYGDDEQLGAFVTVIGDHLPFEPAERSAAARRSSWISKPRAGRATL